MPSLFPKRIGDRADSRSFDRLEGRRRREALRRLLARLRPHRTRLAVALLLTAGANLAALAGPRLSGAAVDRIAGPGAVDFPGVWRLCGWMVLCSVLHAALSWLLGVLMAAVGRDVTRQLRGDAFAHLQELPVRYFDRRQTGDIVSHLSYDIDAVGESLSHDVLQAVVSTLTVVGSLVMMLSISPPLVLVFAVTVPLTLLFGRQRARTLHPLFRRRAAALGRLGGFAEELLSGLGTISAYGQEEAMLEQFDGYSEEAVQAGYEAEHRSSEMGPCVRFLSDLGLALVCLAGACLYMPGGVRIGWVTVSVTLGGLSSFVLYSRRFTGPVNELANLAGEIQSALAAAERVFALLDEPPEPPDRPDAVQLHMVRGRIDADRLSFGYEPGRTVLHSLCLHAEPGMRVAIVGPTGAGKTTVINLLLRFYDPDAGTLRVDGTEVRGAARESLRRQYTMVLQDTWLFSGTVLENIAYGKEGASREEAVRAAKAANLHPFIERLPQGYDTPLTDTSLSGGQRQLLAIARAMVADASLLILDEATSNVDSRTERRIQQAMYRLMEGKTCFVIAHRLSTVRSADRILVVQDGRIAEQGTHEELMQARGLYHALYTA